MNMNLAAILHKQEQYAKMTQLWLKHFILGQQYNILYNMSL